MNLSIYTLLFCFLALVSFLEAKKNSNSKKCSKTLAEIIYTPETCASQYLNNLFKQFSARSELLFAAPAVAESYLYSFAATYGIKIELGTAIGTSTTYSSDRTNTPGLSEQYPNIAHSYLNVPGFTKDTQNFYLTNIVFNDNAEMYYVTFILPLSQTPTC